MSDMAAQTWPRRPYLCLDCRTLLGERDQGTAPCDCGRKQRICSLAENSLDRAAIRREIWGVPPARQQLGMVLVVGIVGVCIGMLWDAAWGSHDLWWVSVTMGAGIGIAGYWGWRRLAGYWYRQRRAVLPRGARRRPGWLGPRSGRVGVALSMEGGELVAPASGSRCLAYGIELTWQRWFTRALMLRDAWSGGFAVKLDSGEVVQVAPGRIRLHMGLAQSMPVSSAMKTQYLDHLNGGAHGDSNGEARDGVEGGGEKFFWGNRVREMCIYEGDRIEVLGPVDAVIDVQADDAPYRDPAAVTFFPQAPARLRRM